jgi:hypothetical protein
VVAGSSAERLRARLSRFDGAVLLHSAAFDDGETLLRVAQKSALGGATPQ